MLLGQVEKPARRRVIDAQDVHCPVSRINPKSIATFLRRGQVNAARRSQAGTGRRSRPANKTSVLALKEKLGPHLKAGEIGRGGWPRGYNIMHGAQFPRGGHLRQVRSSEMKVHLVPLPKETVEQARFCQGLEAEENSSHFL